MVPAQPGDVTITYADIEKARTKLGFNPKTSLHEGLEPFVNWYLNHKALVEAVRRFRLSKK
jgi:UDP-glucuronate 4-epimerase